MRSQATRLVVAPVAAAGAVSVAACSGSAGVRTASSPGKPVYGGRPARFG